MLLDNDVVMMEEDDIIRHATELLDAVDNGWLNDDTKVDRFTYAHLVAMFLATSNMDNGAKVDSYCYDAAIRCGERHIKEKLSAGEKIKVAFLPISAAEWPAGGIYRLMADDDRFEPVVIPVPLIGRSSAERRKVYEQTYRFFEDGNYNVKRIYDSQTEEIAGWDECGGYPDMVIHVTPWYLNMAE